MKQFISVAVEFLWAATKKLVRQALLLSLLILFVNWGWLSTDAFLEVVRSLI